MGKKLHPMRKRAKALDRTRDKFGAKEFALGSADCVAMVRFHLKAMGYKVPLLPKYSTAAGARLALKSQGAKNFEQLLDNLGLERIPAAFMLLGDIALMAAEPNEEEASDLGTLVISVGRKVIGWYPGEPTLVNMELLASPLAAWRV